MVQQARAEELRYFQDMGVYEYAAVAECLRATGRAPITTRWIDTHTHKGATRAPIAHQQIGNGAAWRTCVLSALFLALPPSCAKISDRLSPTERTTAWALL